MRKQRQFSLYTPAYGNKEITLSPTPLHINCYLSEVFLYYNNIPFLYVNKKKMCLRNEKNRINKYAETKKICEKGINKQLLIIHCKPFLIKSNKHIINVGSSNIIKFSCVQRILPRCSHLFCTL